MKLTEPIIRALPSNVKVAMIIILRTQNKNQFIKAVRNLILIIPKFQNNGKENVQMPHWQATLDEVYEAEFDVKCSLEWL